MNRRSLAGRAAASWLALLALAALPSAAQQKYRLKETPAAGDRFVQNNEMSMEMTLTASVNGETTEPMKFSNREKEQFTEDVVAAGKSGPTAVRRVYTIARGVEAEPGKQPKTKVSSLQGKTVVIKRVGGKVVVTATPGKLAEEDRKALLDDLENNGQHFFPDKEIEVGEEWTVDPAVAKTLFDGAEKAEMRGQLAEIVPYQGHQCARIHITVDVSMNLQGPSMPMTVQLEGDVYHALDLQRTLSVKMTGPLKMTGESQQMGQTVKLAGEGTMTLALGFKWIKANGKAVPAAK